MPASTIKVSVCFQCMVVCITGERWRENCPHPQYRWSGFSSSSLVWEDGQNFSLNRRQSGLVSMLVGALWPQSLLKLLLTLRVPPLCVLQFFWKFQYRAQSYFCRWVLGSRWDRYICGVCCYLCIFAYLHLCNSSKMYSFSSSAWLDSMPKSPNLITGTEWE